MRILLLSRPLPLVRLGYGTCRSELTERAWQNAVQGLGNFETLHEK